MPTSHEHVRKFLSKCTALKVKIVIGPSNILVVCLFFVVILVFLGFVASDVLTTICHLATVNVCVIIILSIGNTQISILLLCFLYLFVELMITMNE